MEYFKINYNKLRNISQINFYKIIFLLIIIFILLIVVANNLYIYKTSEFYALNNDNLLSIKINYELSDNIKQSEFITFNDIKTSFEIESYGEYEIIDNMIFQDIYLKLEESFYDNEVGKVVFYYNRISVFNYLLELFK